MTFQYSKETKKDKTILKNKISNFTFFVPLLNSFWQKTKGERKSWRSKSVEKHSYMLEERGHMPEELKYQSKVTDFCAEYS